MAKGILNVFGWLSIVIGALGSALTIMGGSLLVGLAASFGSLIAGAFMLGFVRVIELLEQIASNARRDASAEPVLPSRAIDPLVTKLFEERQTGYSSQKW